MDFANHPCFNAAARHKTGRIHLPVAPSCNVQCNYCDRKYDCVNESRPGVCSSILSPEQALGYLASVLEKVDNLSVVGIAGPGDPFANPRETLATLEAVRAKYPAMTLCVATNGLGLPEYVDRLAALGASHVTVTVNAIDPEIGAKIYAWVRPDKKPYRGVEGAALLIERQAESVRRLKAAGVAVKINTVVIPGVNDAHVPAVARRMAELGADVHNCIPLMHVEGTAFAGVPSPEAGALQAMRFEAGKFLPQISHCARCRADAVGLIGEANGAEVERLLLAAAAGPTERRPYVAVASREGLFVNQHLGEATGLWVFALKDGKATLVDRRPTPAPGGGEERWSALADVVPDCFAILAAGFGKSPESILGARGVKLVAAECLIAEGAGALLAGRELPRAFSRVGGSCGSGFSCGGTGMGCA
jgi:nitrogen fixation protein NifB